MHLEIDWECPLTAEERFVNAQTCIAEGRHAEALADLVWFHEHALAEAPSLAGVRLSFAMLNWVQLAAVYPAARTALEETRDRKTAALLRGEMDKLAFRDVVVINEHLLEGAKTYSLYVALLQGQPDLANDCAPAALGAVLAAEDFHLAARLIPDPQSIIISKSMRLNREVMLLKHRTYSHALTRWAYVCNHVDEIQKLLKIKVGIGDHAEAARLKSLAIALIESPSLRREVQATFVKRSRAPVGRR